MKGFLVGSFVVKTDIKDSRCVHSWFVLSVSYRDVLSFDYLHCPKCQSISCEEIKL